ncbi:MAG TPA: asparagine synthase (glutamine-hydrolyzing), partial [Thermoanaerobaculia bacterium]
MCGISVVVAPSASPEVVRDVLRMHGPIRHRGPDGERVLLIDGDSASPFDAVSQVPLSGRASVAAAFRRLKIIDLTDAAAQPMPSRDRKRWLLFNGEIYNFRELRAELGKRGRSFASTGDAEVALQAYEEWGEQCFGRFEGMWAIVLIDLAARKLIASRDRFGIKPLYYTATRERLLLSSEIRQILAVPSHKPAANPRLLASFLRGDRETVYEETFFEGVRSVPPGCWFELPLAFDRAPQPRFRAYWNLSDCTANGAHPSYEHAVEKTSELMKASVESHRIADVRIGSLLSGGLDSSFIATLLARGAPGGPSTVPTFSFGFRQAAPEYCELRYVDEVVRAERMTNYQSTFDASWVAANAANVVDALEEPPLAVPAFAQYRMFELCREHDTTVVLDGQGSDEIFAGYPFYHRLLLLDYVRQARIPSFLHEAKAIARLASMSTPALLRRSFIHPALYRLLQQVRGAYGWIAPG